MMARATRPAAMIRTRDRPGEGEEPGASREMRSRESSAESTTFIRERRAAGAPGRARLRGEDRCGPIHGITINRPGYGRNENVGGGALRQAWTRSPAGNLDRWLNDAVKAFLGQRGEYDPFLQLDNLSVFVAVPQYLLAMKCVAMRLGEEFHDLDDVRYLLRYLNLSSADAAMSIVLRYFESDQLLPKTRLALEELLPGE